MEKIIKILEKNEENIKGIFIGAISAVILLAIFFFSSTIFNKLKYSFSKIGLFAGNADFFIYELLLTTIVIFFLLLHILWQSAYNENEININPYFWIATWLVLTTILASIILAENQITENNEFEIETSVEQYKNITTLNTICSSKKYPLLVKNDEYQCKIPIYMNKRQTSFINNITIYLIENNTPKKVLANSEGATFNTSERKFDLILSNEEEQKIRINITYIDLLEKESRYFISQEKTLIGFTNQMEALKFKTERINNIFTLLMLGLSISFGAIFTGMRSLQQIIKEGKKNETREEENNEKDAGSK